MNKDLMERYIYAVTKQLPHRMRNDVGAELRGLIEDMLEARCGGMPSSDKDLRVVLTELGTPNELALQYSPDKNTALIGQPYYSTYKLVLRIVLLCVGFGVTVAQVVSVITAGGGSWGIFLEWLGTLAAGMAIGFTWVTVIFAILQRQGVKLDSGFSLGDLPEVPKDSERISRWEPILGIIFFALLAVALLWVPQILRAVVDGASIPIFNAEVMRGRWLLVVLIVLVGVTECSFQLFEGRHTRRFDLFSIGANLVSALLFVLLLSGASVVNPELIVATNALFPGEGEGIIRFAVGNAQLNFLAIVLFSIVLDTAITVYHLIRGYPGKTTLPGAAAD